VPGAFVERKSAAIAWHYREAEPEYGAWRAHELLNDLSQQLAGLPAEVLLGHRVVEVRARGVDKGVYVRSLFPDEKRPPRTFVMGLGDDRTDHDLLEALPSGSVAGHVGGLLPASSSDGRPREHIRIESPSAVRAFLRTLTASIPEREAAPAGRGRPSSG
jgi:trehalose 6-phosphate synthase/phosphatase